MSERPSYPQYIMQPKIFLKSSGKTFTRERYRGLRGLVRHIRSLPSPGGNKRAAVGSYLGPYYGNTDKPPWGRCKWCWGEVERGPTGRPRMWHESCHHYRAAAQGTPTGAGAPRGELVDIETPYGPNRRERCVACGKAGLINMELDHILAIGVARRLGLPFWRRAMSPENVWWICRRCHVAKTAFDRALMRSLDNPITAEQETEPPYTELPLFNFSQEGDKSTRPCNPGRQSPPALQGDSPKPCPRNPKETT